MITFSVRIKQKALTSLEHLLLHSRRNKLYLRAREDYAKIASALFSALRRLLICLYFARGSPKLLLRVSVLTTTPYAEIRRILWCANDLLYGRLLYSTYNYADGDLLYSCPINVQERYFEMAAKTYVPMAVDGANWLHKRLTRYQTTLTAGASPGQVTALVALIACLADFLNNWHKATPTN